MGIQSNPKQKINNAEGITILDFNLHFRAVTKTAWHCTKQTHRPREWNQGPEYEFT